VRLAPFGDLVSSERSPRQWLRNGAVLDIAFGDGLLTGRDTVAAVAQEGVSALSDWAGRRGRTAPVRLALGARRAAAATQCIGLPAAAAGGAILVSEIRGVATPGSLTAKLREHRLSIVEPDVILSGEWLLAHGGQRIFQLGQPGLACLALNTTGDRFVGAWVDALNVERVVERIGAGIKSRGEAVSDAQQAAAPEAWAAAVKAAAAVFAYAERSNLPMPDGWRADAAALAQRPATEALVAAEAAEAEAEEEAELDDEAAAAEEAAEEEEWEEEWDEEDEEDDSEGE